MNQPVFQHTNVTHPPFYQIHPHHHSQTLRTSTSQNIVYQTMTYPIDAYHHRNYNHPNFRNPQTQSYIFTIQNEGVDQNRRLMLDSLGRKAIYHEYNVGQSNSTAPQKRVNPNQQRIQALKVDQSNYSCVQTIKKPLYTSQILSNQNNRIDFNCKKESSDQKAIASFISKESQKTNNQNNSSNAKRNIIIQSLYESIDVKSHRDITRPHSQLNGSQINSSCTYNPHPHIALHNQRITPLKDSTVFLNTTTNLPINLANSINVKLGQPYSTAPSKCNVNNCSPLSTSQTEQRSPILSSSNKNHQWQAQKKQNIQGSFQFRKKKPADIGNNGLIRSSYSSSAKNFSLNDFELLDKIGKGSFGDVFIAQQKITGFLCVIKKLLKKKLIQMKLQEHLLRQIKIQSFLKHRHLTSLYGFFHDESYIYLILEIMPDGSLMQVKKKKKTPQSQVSIYLKQICQGLKYMHTQQIIHRDIKPQNIFLHEGYAKIGDFGCSIYTHSLRNTVVGSLAYISPEQLQQGFYDQKIDVWSLGVMAYEMLLGKSPYQQDIVKIARQEMGPNLSILKFPPEIQLSSEAKDFILSTLHLDSNHRIGIVQALKHSFIRKYERKDQFVTERSVI